MTLHSQFILFLVLFGNSLHAQEVISSQGDSYYAEAGQLAFTIGEVIIQTETNNLNDLTQGFHQTEVELVELEESAALNSIIVYPNPTMDKLYVQIEPTLQVHYDLFDSNGKLITKNTLTSHQNSIRVNGLSPGNYLLKLTDNQLNSKTIRITKSH